MHKGTYMFNQKKKKSFKYRNDGGKVGSKYRTMIKNWVNFENILCFNVNRYLAA